MTQSRLSVVDVWPVFVVLGAGLALSWFVLLIEHVYKLSMDVYTLAAHVKPKWRNYDIRIP